MNRNQRTIAGIYALLLAALVAVPGPAPLAHAAAPPLTSPAIHQAPRLGTGAQPLLQPLGQEEPLPSIASDPSTDGAESPSLAPGESYATKVVVNEKAEKDEVALYEFSASYDGEGTDYAQRTCGGTMTGIGPIGNR